MTHPYSSAAVRLHPISLGSVALCAMCTALALLAVGCAADGDEAGASAGHDAGQLDGASTPSGFAVEVVSFSPGKAAGFGGDKLPHIVLGPPQGGGAARGGLDVVSLGHKGAIVLRLSDVVVDGPGVDLIVFENPFGSWVETGHVAVSDDATNWYTWPCACDDKAQGYPGCAGVHPVLSHSDNGVPPGDPTKAGGDGFDLASIGVKSARYVRVTDSGKNQYEGKTGGFDLDAVAIVHHAP